MHVYDALKRYSNRGPSPAVPPLPFNTSCHVQHAALTAHVGLPHTHTHTHTRAHARTHAHAHTHARTHTTLTHAHHARTPHARTPRTHRRAHARTTCVINNTSHTIYLWFVCCLFSFLFFFFHYTYSLP